MVAAVILWRHASRSRRIAERCVEIDDPVERARGSNPLVNGDAFCLALWRPSAKTLIGKYGCAKNFEAPACVRAMICLYPAMISSAVTGVRLKHGFGSSVFVSGWPMSLVPSNKITATTPD